MHVIRHFFRSLQYPFSLQPLQYMHPLHLGLQKVGFGPAARQPPLHVLRNWHSHGATFLDWAVSDGTFAFSDGRTHRLAGAIFISTA